VLQRIHDRIQSFARSDEDISNSNHVGFDAPVTNTHRHDALVLNENDMASFLPVDLGVDLAEGFDNFTPQEDTELR